jgi:hypothetical protein
LTVTRVRARATTQPTSATPDACRMTHGDGHDLATTWTAVQRASAELLDAARRHAARDDAPPELVALLEQERRAVHEHLVALARRHRSP